MRSPKGWFVKMKALAGAKRNGWEARRGGGGRSHLPTTSVKTLRKARILGGRRAGGACAALRKRRTKERAEGVPRTKVPSPPLPPPPRALLRRSGGKKYGKNLKTPDLLPAPPRASSTALRPPP